MTTDFPDLVAAGLDRFVESGLSMSLASCDLRNVPSLARAYGCHCRVDGQLALFLARSQSSLLLRDLQLTGTVAAVFSRPSSHQTIQIKGRGAQVLALQEGDAERVCTQMDLLMQDILAIGFLPAPLRTLLSYDLTDLVAVQFRPAAIFGQSPGPRAGELLRGADAS